MSSYDYAARRASRECTRLRQEVREKTRKTVTLAQEDHDRLRQEIQELHKKLRSLSEKTRGEDTRATGRTS